MDSPLIHREVGIITLDILEGIGDRRFSVYRHLYAADTSIHALYAVKLNIYFHIIVRYIHVGILNIILKVCLLACFAQKMVCLFIQEAEFFHGLALRYTIGSVPFLFVDGITKLPVVLQPFLHEQFM